MAPYDQLQQSYGRCLREKNFIARFYEIFMATDPEIEAMFAKTDFNTQRMALRRGISSAIEHANGSRLAERTVLQMAQIHSRTGRVPVRPSLYHHWVESLVQAVSEIDPQADAALLELWREGMNKVIQTFTSHY